ncbi:uncharacterized protein ACN63O_024165 [Diretmus argenteus]
MHVCLLLGSLTLSATGYFLVSAHMIPHDDITLSTNTTVNRSLSPGLYVDSPPIVINKFPEKKKRPPPPPNCVALWGSCKSPDNICCEHCAFCQCRLFKTVCYCRMGNPRC